LGLTNEQQEGIRRGLHWHRAGGVEWSGHGDVLPDRVQVRATFDAQPNYASRLTRTSSGPHLAEVLERCGFGGFRALLQAPAVQAPGECKTLAGPTGRVLRGLRPKQRMQPTGGRGAGRRSGGAPRLSR
jgi:hypothetical protein